MGLAEIDGATAWEPGTVRHPSLLCLHSGAPSAANEIAAEGVAPLFAEGERFEFRAGKFSNLFPIEFEGLPAGPAPTHLAVCCDDRIELAGPLPKGAVSGSRVSIAQGELSLAPVPQEAS